MDISKKINKYLDSNLFITTEEANSIGVNKTTLSRLVQNDELIRLSRGVYVKEFDWLTDDLKRYVVPCAKYNGAVVAGISSLSYHNLTDQEERQTWLAVKPPEKVQAKNYRTLRLSGNCYSLGIMKHSFGNRKVLIYDAEKSVVDAFKYLWEEVAFKALKAYLKRDDKNVKKLCEYGVKLKKPLDDYVVAILSDE